MAHIVIMGAGIGGVPMAYEMREAVGKADTVTVVSNSPTFHFTPSNPWVAVNWREREDIEIDLAPVLKKHGIEFSAVGVAKVHPKENRLELLDGGEIVYDYLIIATGPALAFDEIEGFGPMGGLTQSVCHVDHAAHAAEAWEKFCANPGPILVGAVQGASCYGPAYEFAAIMDTDLRRRKIRDKVPMTFVTAEPYIGHLGLGGVGDSRGMMESILRSRHINWICNAKVEKFADGAAHVLELDDDGKEKKRHVVPFAYSMLLPAFRGIPAVQGVEGLVNPRGFILVDKHQRNAAYPNIFAVGVCVAIPPVGPTPVPVGVPKTGYMIESMVTATAHNIANLLADKEPDREATWNAICLADFGDSGAAFVALPQIPPRNVNWFSTGWWVHAAKIAFEKYFLHKVRAGTSEPIYEKYVLKALGITKLKDKILHHAPAEPKL
jgi:sulfide:quinone oxidoreductase